MNFAQTLLCGILSQYPTIFSIFRHRTNAQAHKQNIVLGLFGKTGASSALGQKTVLGRSHFMAFKKFRNGCFGFRAFYKMTKQGRRIEGAVQIRINFSGKKWSL